MEAANSPVKCWAHAVSPCAESDSTRAASASLCAKHRQELAPLTQALVDLENVMREIERLREVRKTHQKAWTPVRFTVDGVGIERGALQLVLEHALTEPAVLDGFQPPTWLASVIFGKKKLAEGCGAALVARVGDAIFDSTRMGFSLGKSERTGRFESGVLELREGWKLLCSWETPINELGPMRLGDTKYTAGEDTLFHPRRVSFRSRELDLALSLDFDWSGRWSVSKYPNVAKLRQKGLT